MQSKLPRQGRGKPLRSFELAGHRFTISAVDGFNWKYDPMKGGWDSADSSGVCQHSCAPDHIFDI